MDTWAVKMLSDLQKYYDRIKFIYFWNKTKRSEILFMNLAAVLRNNYNYSSSTEGDYSRHKKIARKYNKTLQL